MVRVPAELHIATGTDHREPGYLRYDSDGASIAFEAQRPAYSEDYPAGTSLLGASLLDNRTVRVTWRRGQSTLHRRFIFGDADKATQFAAFCMSHAEQDDGSVIDEQSENHTPTDNDSKQ